MGLKITPIAKLRENKTDALSDGQAFFLTKIREMRRMTQAFEEQKPKQVQSLKPYLMTRE
jgi:hypothetical protein